MSNRPKVYVPSSARIIATETALGAGMGTVLGALASPFMPRPLRHIATSTAIGAGVGVGIGGLVAALTAKTRARHRERIERMTKGACVREGLGFELSKLARDFEGEVGEAMMGGAAGGAALGAIAAIPSQAAKVKSSVSARRSRIANRLKSVRQGLSSDLKNLEHAQSVAGENRRYIESAEKQIMKRFPEGRPKNKRLFNYKSKVREYDTLASQLREARIDASSFDDAALSRKKVLGEHKAELGKARGAARLAGKPKGVGLYQTALKNLAKSPKRLAAFVLPGILAGAGSAATYKAYGD